MRVRRLACLSKFLTKSIVSCLICVMHRLIYLCIYILQTGLSILSETMFIHATRLCKPRSADIFLVCAVRFTVIITNFEINEWFCPDTRTATSILNT
jgi:hypothetical protein